MLGSAAALAISLYPRYVSPCKVFCCAYWAQTRRRSCSAYAKAVATRLGFVVLIQALPRQFDRCRSSWVARPVASRGRQSTAGARATKNQRSDKRDLDPFDVCDVANRVDISGCGVPCDCLVWPDGVAIERAEIWRRP